VPVSIDDVGQGLLRGDVHTPAVRSAGEQPEHGHLGTHGLARPGWGSYEHVVIRVVDGVQDLGLHRVEVDEGVVVDVLVVFVPEGRHGKWLQVQ